MHTVTREWIFSNRTPRGSWNAKQLREIGVRWPPRVGWIGRADGRQISDDAARRFEAFGAAGKPARPNVAKELDDAFANAILDLS